MTLSTPSVHILWRGAVLCGSLHGTPRNWGNVARWVGANDPSWPEQATCASCREQIELLERQLLSERCYASGIFVRPQYRPSMPLLSSDRSNAP